MKLTEQRLSEIQMMLDRMTNEERRQILDDYEKARKYEQIRYPDAVILAMKQNQKLRELVEKYSKLDAYGAFCKQLLEDIKK